MFLELIAVIFAGLAVAGIMLLLNRFTGGRLPRWAAPAGAGLGMIAVTIASEYGWYDRTTATLPDGLEIVQTVENSSPYRPWTLAAPYIDRFAALDTGSIKSNQNLPGLHLVDLYVFGRWKAPQSAPIAVDCAGLRHAALGPSTTFTDSGIENVDWHSVTPDDPTFMAVCESAGS